MTRRSNVVEPPAAETPSRFPEMASGRYSFY